MGLHDRKQQKFKQIDSPVFLFRSSKQHHLAYGASSNRDRNQAGETIMAFFVTVPVSSTSSLFHGVSTPHVSNRHSGFLSRNKAIRHRHVRNNSWRVTTTKCCIDKEMSESDRTQQLLDVLSEIEDPDLHQNIVSLGFIKDIKFSQVPSIPSMYDVSFSVELTTPACPVKETFQSDCKRLSESIPWIGKSEITMTSIPPGASYSSSESNSVFQYVNSIIAVASCKGGVGKSTTAVNLAYSLSKQGARVGILDADIYGPSLPTLINPEDRAVQFSDGRIQPLKYKNVKLMSFGYINPDSAIMRGPMISSMLNQIATTTQWGVLDYLIIDMPPGTGDIQLTLSQIVNIDAAVIVTTPQKLSFVDVIKGIDMFDKVEIPSIAIIENMSYFKDPDSNKKHYIFGKGHKDKLESDYGILNSFQIPLVPEINECSDSGVPYVSDCSDTGSGDIMEIFDELTSCVVREVSKIKHGGMVRPEVDFDEQVNVITVKKGGGDVQKVVPMKLRSECRCAVCVDEMTGRVKLEVNKIPANIRPNVIKTVGNYAVEIVWSDGHASLYPYSRFVDNWDSPQVSRLEQQNKNGYKMAVS